jgi:ATP-dependent DNA ligase
MDHRELERLWRKLQPLAVDKLPLDEPPPRNSRFGLPLVLSRVHWVRPEMVVEVSYRRGRKMAYCGRSCIWASGRTSQRLRCGETDPEHEAYPQATIEPTTALLLIR